MGMSTHIVGYRERDDEWEKHEKVWKACEEAGVAIPDETVDYFDDERPFGKPGQEVDIEDAVTECGDEASHGYDVDITKLPKNVKTVRFYNSW